MYQQQSAHDRIEADVFAAPVSITELPNIHHVVKTRVQHLFCNVLLHAILFYCFKSLLSGKCVERVIKPARPIKYQPHRIN